QHSALGAGRNQPWRRWFGIQAAVARTFLRCENTGLALEAENRSIDVGLARKDTGIVHQVARRKIVGAVGDDVEFLKQFQRIFAGKPGIEFTNVQKWID